MSSVETGQPSAVETGQMCAAETGQMSAVETRQMYSIETRQSPVSIVGTGTGTEARRVEHPSCTAEPPVKKALNGNPEKCMW